MSDLTQTVFALSAGVRQRQKLGFFKYVFIEDASGDFEISFGGTSTVTAHKSKTLPVGDIQSEIFVTSATSQTVKIQTSMEPIRTGRSNVTATVNTTIAPSDTITNPGDVTAGAAASLLIAADANRKEVEFCLPSTAINPVRIGNASVTASSGSILEPGCSKTFGSEAAWYVIRTAAPDETVTVLSQEKP